MAARTKLPLRVIATGTTPHMEESHFGDFGYHHADHSESEWQTTETFTRWLNWLRTLSDDGGTLWGCLIAIRFSEKGS
jgi:hypothetical protein